MDVAEHSKHTDLLPCHLSPQENDGIKSESLISSNADTVAGRPVFFLKPNSHSATGNLKPTVAALTSLAAIVLLIFLCRRFNTTSVELGLPSRRLSNNEEPSSSGLKGVCEGGTSESDSEASLRRAREEEEKGTSEPAVKLQKLATDEGGGKSSSESVSLSFSRSDADARKPSSTLESRQHTQSAASSSQQTQARHAMGSHTQQPAHTSASHLTLTFFKTRLFTDEELAAARGLVALQNEQHQRPSREAAASATPIQQQQLASVAGFDSGAGTSGAHVRAVSSSRSVASWRKIRPQHSSTSSDDPLLTGPSERDWRFVRLPRVPPGNYSHLFKMKAAAEKWPYRQSKYRETASRFVIVATMLAKESLSDDDLAVLGANATMLAFAIRNKDNSQINASQGFHRIVRLARCFLALNALVSAMHVLCVPRGNSWWNEITSKLPRPPGPLHIQWNYNRDATQYNRHLEGQLRLAIETLRKQELLEENLLVHIHNLLFFHKYSKEELVNSTWNIWKNDSREEASGGPPNP